jgi:hypothetical protein
MSGPIRYLLARSAWNRTRRIASEFKKPGPRIAAVAAVGYFGFLAWLSPRSGGTAHDTQIAAVVGALGLLVLVLSAWLLGTGSKLVELSSAERALLLPAPISGGRVMDVKLMRLQVTALGNAVMWTALTSGGQEWGTIGRRVVAFWVVLTTLQLHRIGAARSRASAAIHPGLRRSLGLFGIGLVALVPIVLSGAIRESARGSRRSWASLRSTAGARPTLAVRGPPAAVDRSNAGWIAELGGARDLLLHYLWVRRVGPELERGRTFTSPTGAPL